MADKYFFPATDTDFATFTDTVIFVPRATNNANVTESFTIPASLKYQGPQPLEGTTPTITVGGLARVVTETAPADGQVQIDRSSGVLTFHSSDAAGTAEVTITPYATWVTTGFLKRFQNLAGGGSGDVTGPATSTDTAIAVYDGTGGDTLADTGVTIDASDNVSGIATLNATTLNPTNALALDKGGTGSTTASGARTALGLGTIATQNSTAVAITGGTIEGVTIDGLAAELAVAEGGTGASTAIDARTNLGLGTIATQNSNAVSITGGSVVGSTLVRSTASKKIAYAPNTANSSVVSGSVSISAVQALSSSNGAVMRCELLCHPGDVISAFSVTLADFGGGTRGVNATLARRALSNAGVTTVSGPHLLTSNGATEQSQSITAHTVLAGNIYYLEFTFSLPTAGDVFVYGYSITKSTREL